MSLQQGRIVSGTPAAKGEFPWQAIIKEDEDDTLKCGGSVISERWVMTAAHCTDSLKSVCVVFGTIQLNNTVHNMTSSDIYIHPQYSPPNVNDISLIRLPRALVFSNLIQPIVLVSSAEAANDFVGSTGIIAGFGLMDDEYLDYSQFLLWAQVKIVAIRNCQQMYPQAEIDENNLCAVGDGNTNMSTCSGDSGGPLIVIINGSPVQIGINSFVATDMCTEGYPSGYVRLSSYLGYISRTTGLSFY